MAYKLDPSKAQTWLISNDAFFWLKDEEDPLDESNLEEAEEILAMFPNGFVIQDNWKYTEPDTIEATFIPYIESEDIVWDGECRMKTNNKSIDPWAFLFKIIDKTRCYARWANDISGKCIFEGECEIRYFFNKPWALPGKSQLPLWGNQVKYFTDNRL